MFIIALGVLSTAVYGAQNANLVERYMRHQLTHGGSMRYGEKPRACDLQEFAQERGIQLTMGQATREIRNYNPAARAPRAPRVRKTLHQNTAEVLAHRWVNNKYTANDCITFSK